MELTFFQIFEIVIGLSFFWIGIYLLSRNPKSMISWIIFLIFSCCTMTLYTDPVLRHSPNLNNYIAWQKATDFGIILMPFLVYYLSMIFTDGLINKKTTFIYLFIGLLFWASDIHGGLLLKEDVIRLDDYRRLNGFGPGPLMIPFGLYSIICFINTINRFREQFKKGFYGFKYAIIGSCLLILSVIISLFSFYFQINKADEFFTYSYFAGIGFLIFTIIRYYNFISKQSNIFDKSFLFRTISVLFLLMAYIGLFLIIWHKLDFLGLIFLLFLVLSILITHSFGDWFTTFINDLVYNSSDGFSVVSDEEIANVLKNYNHPEKLEKNSLLRLNIIYNNLKYPIELDGLREEIKKAINYFKPDEDAHRRTKKNLKYHLLKMITFDEAEEGQILWELGFDEYPTSLRNGGTEKRKPIFARFYPSDYTYTSRNAYLALRKEAIHDIAWRISYLEKQTRRNLF